MFEAEQVFHHEISKVSNVLRHKKTGLWDVRPGTTQTLCTVTEDDKNLEALD